MGGWLKRNRLENVRKRKSVVIAIVETISKCVEASVKKQLNEIIGNVEDSDAFGKKVKALKEEIEVLKSTRKIEEAEIRHLVRMKEEKLALEYEKKGVEQQAEFQNKQMTLQSEYHDKIMAKIDEAAKQQQDTYKEIMKRLPNINVEIAREPK